jgi:Tol biopolymer transport system component
MSSELREVFEMVTKQTEPEPDARWEQEQRQRRRSRNRKLGALAIATTIGIVAVVVSVVSLSRTAEPPVDEPTPRPTPARLGSLAYAARGDIFVAGWDGSNPVGIADGRSPSDCHDVGEYSAQAPIWSPDGRYLAYRHMDCNAPAFQTPGSWWDVVISDAEGNVVTSFPSEAWGISWSPDSTRVAVWVNSPPDPPLREAGDRSTIDVYGLNGERQTLLTLPDSAAGTRNPVWSPDGRSLLLDKFEIPLDGSTPRPLPFGIRRGWALSPDGSRVAYASRKLLFVAAADGSAGVEVLGDGASPNLLWSPTGDRIAFTSPGSRELRLVDVATGTVTLLIEPDGSAVLSVIEFSPDGDRILFSRTEEDGTGANSLWSVNADGSHLRRLVTGTDWGDWLSHSQTG